jgi:hypothetical protein
MQMQHDIEFNFPFGFKELEGFTLTDFDLKHTKSSLVENFNILMPNQSDYVPLWKRLLD